MLTKRLIPCLDVKEGRVVKGVSFVNLRDAGDPVELAETYSDQGADELVFLDISASHEGRQTMVEVVEETAAKVTIPFTVGGGVNHVDDMRRLLRAGADKVSMNSAAVKRPELISEGAEMFGSQCIVVAIDGKYDDTKNRWEVYTHGGRKSTGQDVVEWAREAERLGAGEILLTSMDCDGQKDGFDLSLTRSVSETVGIPVIASGGAGAKNHFYDAFEKAASDAALAASIFHYEETSISEVKSYLKERGLPIR